MRERGAPEQLCSAEQLEGLSSSLASSHASRARSPCARSRSFDIPDPFGSIMAATEELPELQLQPVIRYSLPAACASYLLAWGDHAESLAGLPPDDHEMPEASPFAAPPGLVVGVSALPCARASRMHHARILAGV